MDAIKIALETILVGAMALPWLFLVLHLFFPGAGDWLKSFPIGKEGISYGIAAVLAIAMGYTLGAAAARLAQDLFNDDDLPLSPPTEDAIRASAYCDPKDAQWFSGITILLPTKKETALSDLCKEFGSLAKGDGDAERNIRQMFKLQESTVLLTGEDKTSQLRHMHQQLMVLRGAAFNGLIACVFLAFGWNGEKKWGRWRLILPLCLLFYFCYALVWNHWGKHDQSKVFHFWQYLSANDPPFMELAGLGLAIAGCYLAIRDPSRPANKPLHDSGSEPALLSGLSYGSGFIVAALLTAVSYGGWYWTEILYDQMVIDSYYVNHYLLKSVS